MRTQSALEGLPGVIYARVSYKKGVGEVLFDSEQVNVKKMIEVIATEGFDAKLSQVAGRETARGPDPERCGLMNAFC